MKLIFLLLGLLYIQNVYGQTCKSRYSPNYTGSCTSLSSCQGAILNNLCPGSLKCCITDNSYTPQTFVTSAQLKSITGVTTSRMDYIAKALRPPIANPTCNQKATFISQLAHESGNFIYDEEIGSEDYFSKYDFRADLGNSKVGDGARYRGRGFIQLTGKSNYNRAGAALGLDLVNNPEMAAFPSVSARVAVWFWTSGSITNLNNLADGTFHNYTMMTYRINGGINGLADRTNLLVKAMSEFGCGTLTKGRGENCVINSKTAACKPLCVTGLEGRSFCGCSGTSLSGLCSGPSNLKCCLE